MDEVLRRIGEIGADPAVPLGEQPFLEVNVVNDGPDPSRRHRIEQELIGKGVRLAVIRQHQPAEATPPIHSETGAPQVLADLSTLDPESLLQDAFREKYSTDLPQELLVALRELLATEAADSTAS